LIYEAVALLHLYFESLWWCNRV